MINNKKAQIPSTIVWIVGTFLVLLIMVLYLVFGGITYLEKGQSKVILSADSEKFSKEFITGSLIAFLESKTSNGESVYDILSEADIEKKDETSQSLFEEEASNFIETKFFADVFNSEYYRAWIRVYKSDAEVDQYYDGYYKYMNYLRGDFGGVECNPSEKGSLLMSIPIIPDKKIVLCANPSN